MPFALVCAIAFCMNQNEPTTSAPATAPTLTFELQQPPDAAFPENWAWEAELERLARRCVEEVQTAPNDAARSDAALRAAALLLSRRCEPALSRMLQGIASPEDGRTLTANAEEARRLLAARPVSQPASAPANTTDNTEPSIADDAEYLAALADALAAVGESPSIDASADEAVRGRLTAAATIIAPYLDDARPAAAGLARLLQATCYRRAGRADRATEVLGTGGGPDAILPYEVFARLEYCRALADQGYHVAALALAARLETGASVRIPLEHRTAAVQSFRKLRMELWRAWSEQLRAGDDAELVNRAKAQRDRLAKSFNTRGPVLLYRFGQLLPQDDETARE
ncbi:MAG: hypothetical protein L6R00_12440 [Phycisphaerae bacterium]|nr:hypothetical protein [Phycisphaerae bacterium]